MKEVIVIGLLAFATGANVVLGQNIIAQWSFNAETLEPCVGAGTATLIGRATGAFATGSSADQSNPVNRAWNISGFPPQGRDPRTAGAQFAVDTSGYENIALLWDHRFSGTASRRAVLQVAVDGQSFADALVIEASGEGWTNNLSVDLRYDPAFGNNPMFAFRIVSDFDRENEYVAAKAGSAYSSAGTWRLDRVTVTGTQMGVPAEAPQILVQPQSVVVPLGAQAVFTVSVSGSEPLRYQWWFGEATIAGATNRTLALSNVSKANEGVYRVVASNWLAVVVSDPACLKVVQPPSVQFTNAIGNIVRPGDAPTNSFTEFALHPGENLVSVIRASDPEGGWVTVEPDTADMPDGVAWDFESRFGHDVTGRFEFKAARSDAGRTYPIRLSAWNAGATNTTVWKVHVLSPIEQGLVLTEYLANPTSSPESPFYNPLHRETAAPNPTQHDEYIELVNFSEEDIDLQGWSISDAAEVRHYFDDTLKLPSMSAIVVYGGPVTDNPPALNVLSLPARATSAGLSLNNGGDSILIRNAAGDLILRVVYTSKMIAPDGSMTRYPDADSQFVRHPGIATLPVSPGVQPDGRRWVEFEPQQNGPVDGLKITVESGGTLSLSWNGRTGQTITVWVSDRIEGPYVALAAGLTGTRYDGLNCAEGGTRFYRVSTP